MFPIELILVRHGETTWNAARLVQGHNDEAVLTERGLQQAAALAEGFGETAVAALWSSDLQRARATAEPLADGLGLPLQVHSGLRERNFGRFEGGPVEDLSPAVTGVADHRVVDPDVEPPGGGESVRQFSARVERSIREIAAQLVPLDEPQSVVLVVHGGTIRVAEGFLRGVPVEELGWGPVENTAVIRHSFSPDLLEECR